MKTLGPYRGYLGTVEESLEDGCYWGKLLEVDALVTYEDSQLDELPFEFERAVDEYLKLKGRTTE